MNRAMSAYLVTLAASGLQTARLSSVAVKMQMVN
jgi:hypothetical protein